MGRFLSESQLLQELSKARKGRQVVFTNGCFDLLHIGHVRYLQDAKTRGDLLVVALNTDASVRALKGPERPVQKENDRAEILAALGCVDYTLLFDEPTPERIIKEIRPDVLVKGGDWKVDQIVGGSFVQSYGGQVLSLPFVEGRSTTNLIEKARQKT
ncbi:MAG: D-glycero-beta-D-manno-heptose 1-phosphate adenylyltransferase [Bdellovibrionales bacterium]